MSRLTSRQAIGTALAVAGLAVLASGTQSVLAAGAQEHVGQYAQADIEYGLRLYRSTCIACHAESGAGVTGVNLAMATPRAPTDDTLAALILTGIEGTAMPPGAYSESELTALVAYVRTMGEFDLSNVRIGDAASGESIVMGKGDCTSCHRLHQQGSLGLAPELTAIGAVRTAGALEAALVTPDASMYPINRPVRLVLADGTVVNGRRLNEDTYSVQLIDEDGALRSFEKATLRDFTIIKTSPMPSFADTLTTQEIADVVAYLLTLRGVEGLD
jgi:putative heme-binding domain-containing protein